MLAIRAAGIWAQAGVLDREVGKKKPRRRRLGDWRIPFDSVQSGDYILQLNAKRMALKLKL